MTKKNKVKGKNSQSGNVQPTPTVNNTKTFKENLLVFFLLKPQNFFSIAALIFGSCFMLSTAPYQVVDEMAHFERAYKLSEFKTVQKIKDDVSGDYIPKSMHSVFEQFWYLAWQPNNKVKKEQIMDALKVPLEKDSVKFVNIDASAYFYFSYLPQIPAVWLGKSLNLSSLYILYLGRLFGLLFYVLCVWYAIKIIPVAKYLMLTISLLPMCLAQAASWNADGVVYSLSFLGIAMVIKRSLSIENFKMDKSFFLLLAILSIMGVLKPIYIPIAFLIFLIPRLFFKSTYSYLAYTISAIVLTCVFTYVWRDTYSRQVDISAPAGISSVAPDIPIVQVSNPPVPVDTPPTTAETNNVVTEAPTKADVLMDNPMMFIDVLRATFKEFKTMYYRSTIGILGYLDTLLPKGVYSAFTFLIFFLALFEADKRYKILIYQRLILLVVSLSVFYGTILAMYLATRPEAGLIAEGVQGRYFIPAVFPFFLAFYGLIPLKINLSSNKYLVFLLYFVLIILLYRTELTLISRYFGNT